MAFVTRYGNTISENGWRMVDADECDFGPVPGTPLKLPIRKGIANLILKGWAAYFHREIESLDNGRGFTDEGAWTPVNDVATSNHLAATAVDLNWNDHAFRVWNSGFTAAEIERVRIGQRAFDGGIWWGNDWESPRDAMHFQLAWREGDARNAALATKLQGGHLGIWTGAVPPPRPVEDVYAKPGDSGPKVANLQNFLNKNYSSYSRLDVDGDYGPLTENVVKLFQGRVGVLMDGIVGPETLRELVARGFKVGDTVVIAPPPPPPPNPVSDRELLERIDRNVTDIHKSVVK